MIKNFLEYIVRYKNTSIRILFNDNQNKKRRPVKIFDDHALEGISADNCYKEAVKKRKGYGRLKSSQLDA